VIDNLADRHDFARSSRQEIHRGDSPIMRRRCCQTQPCEIAISARALHDVEDTNLEYVTGRASFPATGAVQM
jgi:hypothetical protein